MKGLYISESFLKTDAAGIRSRTIYKFLNDEIISFDGYSLSKATKGDCAKYSNPLWVEKFRHGNIFFMLLNEFFSLIGLFFFIIRSRSNYDYYVISSPPFVTSLFTSLLIHSLGKKLIFDIRDLYPDLLFMKSFLNQNNFLAKGLIYLTQKVYNNSFLFIATNGMRLKIKKNLTHDNEILLLNGFVGNAVSEISFDDKDERFTVIFHGTLARSQDAFGLVHIIENCPNVSFKLYSKGRDYKKISKLLINKKNVSINGIISKKQLDKEIKKSHIGISLRDNSELSKASNPVKIFDYISCGIPCINTPFSEINEIEGIKQMTKSFETGDYKSISNFLNSLERDEDLYKKEFIYSYDKVQKLSRENLLKSKKEKIKSFFV